MTSDGIDDPGELLKLAVPAALEAERVDRGVALLAGLSRAQAARLVDEGRVRISGPVVRAGSRRLRSGELLEVDLAGHPAMEPGPVARGPTAKGPPQDNSGGRSLETWLVGGKFGFDRPSSPSAVPGPPPLAAAVVFADQDLVVVDKPAGLVVHPGAGNRYGTLLEQLVGLFPEISAAGPEGDRPGIVQRLDKGTSGLMVVARTPAAREGLVAQLAARSVDRAYLAVVHGELEADEGTVDAPLGRSQSHRVKMAVVQGGRHALTHYRAEGRSSSPMPVTLVSCRLGTGRTHQVRVHFAAIGHPVLSDDRYSKPSQLAAARNALPGLRRPWLHAARLGFTHPVTGEPMYFSCELPPDLAETLGLLGLSLP